MSYLKFILISALCLVIFNGCGLRESVVQKEQLSYISFTGNTNDSVLIVDALAPINLDGTDENVRYEISPGKHHIVVLRDEIKIVDRVVFLGSGSVKEINIP